jgi:SAM-dependent methyltransferase
VREVKPAEHSGAEAVYRRLAVCRFVRPHVEGGSVAYLDEEESGKGGLLLAAWAGTVTRLSDSPAPRECNAPNLEHHRVKLPHLPYPDGYFDAVVAPEVLEAVESPEALVREAKRVLAPDGTFVLSAADRQAHANALGLRGERHRRELYVPEIRALLEEHFEAVNLYGLGAISGGLVTAPGADLSRAAAETLEPGDEPDSASPTRFVLAVCGGSGLPRQETPLLLLDPNGGIFDESRKAREHVELLEAEIVQMQSTEVQAFRDALRLERGRVSRLEAREKKLAARLREIEGSRAWRLLGLYRRVRSLLASGREKNG